MSFTTLANNLLLRTRRFFGTDRPKVRRGARLGVGPVAAAVRTPVETLEDRTLLNALASPTTPQVSVNGDNFTVTWNAISGATGYQLERAVSGGIFVPIYTGTSLSHTDLDVGQNQSRTVAYRVRATSVSVESDWSFIGGVYYGMDGFDPQWFYVTLEGHTLDRVDSLKNTWVLTHGWNSEPASWADSAARLIGSHYDNHSVLTYDWSSASNTDEYASINPGSPFFLPAWISESRIKDAARWLSNTIASIDVAAFRLRFIGHSHGSYVSAEAAKALPGRERLMVALDPAVHDVLSISYNGADAADFALEFERSWAFFEADPVNVASQDAASTAHNSIAVKNITGSYAQTGHSAITALFQNILEVDNYATQWFQPGALTSQEQPWNANEFTDSGDAAAVEDGGDHEAVVFASGAIPTVQLTRFFWKDDDSRPQVRQPTPFSADTLLGVSAFNITPMWQPLLAPLAPFGADTHVVASTLTGSNEFRIAEQVRNFSNSASGPTTVVYYASRTGLSTSPIFEIGRRIIPQLSPNAIDAAIRDVNLDDIPAEAIAGGITYIGVAINPAISPDPDQALWTRLDLPLTFGNSDLVGLDFNLDPVATTYAWGSTLDATFRVENLGTAFAEGPFYAGVYLSNDPVFDGSDYLLGAKQIVDGVAARSKVGASVRFALPGAAPAGFSDGPVYIGLWVDSQGDVDEGDESNNQGRGNAVDYRMVQVAGNLSNNGEPTIGTFSAGNPSVIRGTKVWLTATGVVDNGVVNEVVFYLDSNGTNALDEGDMYLGHGSKDGSEFKARVDTTNWPTGTQQLFARALDNEGNYSRVAQTAIDVIGNSPANPDDYEQNDSSATAHYLGGPGFYQLTDLSITEGDEDWFAFDIPDGDANIDLRIDFFQEASGLGDLFLNLLRRTPSGGLTPVEFADTSSTGNTQERIIRSDVTATRYYVRVGPVNRAGVPTQVNGNYTLTVNVTPVAGAPAVGHLVASSSTIYAGQSVDVWFTSVSGISGGSDGAVFYRDVNRNGVIDGPDGEYIAVDWGPTGNLNGLYGASVSTSGWLPGLHYIHAYVFRSSGPASLARTVAINVVPERPPEIASVSAPSTVNVGDNLTVTAAGVIDPDGTVSHVRFYRDLNNDNAIDGGDQMLGTGTRSGTSWSLTTSTASWALGTHRIIARATDNRGNQSDPVAVEVEVTTVPNAPPVIGSFTVPSIVIKGQPLTLTASNVTDLNSDPLDPVQFFIDMNGDGAVDGGDTLLGAGVQSGNTWSLTVDTSTLTGGPTNLLARVQEQGGGLQAVVSGFTSIRTEPPPPDPIVIVGNVAQVSGTDDADVFRFDLGSRTVSVNNVTEVLPGNVTEVQFDGQDGNDQLTLTGTAGTESVRLLPMQMFLDSSSVGLTGSASSVETIFYDGNGGNDVATFSDSAGNDVFTSSPTEAQMRGPGYVNIARVPSAVANASSGNDRATLRDGVGRDRFLAWSNRAAMMGSGFVTQVFGFDSVTGVASAGVDIALLNDGNGNDTFIGRPTVSVRVGAGFANAAENFDRVIARSTNGSDTGRLFGSSGNDAYSGRPGFAALSGTGFDFSVEGFAKVIGRGQGGTDLVRFFGGPGDDLFVATSNFAQMSGPGFDLQAFDFTQITGVARPGGNDRAFLFDSTGDDDFTGFGSFGQLTGLGFSERASGFDFIRIFGTRGGRNRLNLFPNNPINYQLVQTGQWV